ncbi:MAG: hypothetical protein PHU77_05195 [Simplicispira sp.]|nr:hypothetical protein [Simplicispira sp.]
MSTFCPLADTLLAEHLALCRAYAAAQERCSRLVAQQQADIAQLQAQVLRLRAAAIVQVSALAFVRADPAPLAPVNLPATPMPGTLALLQASMAAADLVICQTGCLSHGAYWRDNGHCRRTGQACALPGAPATTHLMVKNGSSPCHSSADSYQNK